MKFRPAYILLFILFAATLALAGVDLDVGTKLAKPNPSGVDVRQYPAADDMELGHIKWVLKLANQNIADFNNFQQLDDQGTSARRYEIAFSSYFLAMEQFHKFPAWQGPIANAMDRLNQKMLEKTVWQYWAHESQGVTKFEPKMDRPYPSEKDPVKHRNIMYSAHVALMMNLYEMLYNDRKWDKPGSIVFKWNDSTRFAYDNQTLQEAMFLQFINNPVPGIECEPNVIFPICNEPALLSWKLYDKMHGSRYFAAAQPEFDRFFKTQFINPKTHEIGAFYLVKQGWVFSNWNPVYGNKMDGLIQSMVATTGANFNSATDNGWNSAFINVWNPKLVQELWPYMKKSVLKIMPDGSALLQKDSVFPDADYGFFVFAAAELGDEQVKNGLMKTIERDFAPVWGSDGSYHYPFIDANKTVNLGSDDKKNADPSKPAAPPSPPPVVSAPCCLSPAELSLLKRMDTMPQHSNVADRVIAMARAMPKNGFGKMFNEPFDAEHFSEPAISDVDISKVSVTRAIYDRSKKALIVSAKLVPKEESGGFQIVNLNPAKSYQLYTSEAKPTTISNSTKYLVSISPKSSQDFVLKEGK